MIRGPRSRAGLIAYPVGPPSDMPMTRTSSATARPVGKFAGSARMPNSRTAVPMISVIRFAAVLRMAGPVQNTASFRPGSSVSDQCTR